MDQASTATVEFLEDKIRYACPLNRIKNRMTVEPGDIRQVKWSDGNFYKAKILNTENDGRICVQYLQDKVKHRTNIGCVKNCSLQTGDVRQVKWTDGKYYRARVLQIESGKLMNRKSTKERFREKTSESAERAIACNALETKLPVKNVKISEDVSDNNRCSNDHTDDRCFNENPITLSENEINRSYHTLTALSFDDFNTEMNSQLFMPDSNIITEEPNSMNNSHLESEETPSFVSSNELSIVSEVSNMTSHVTKQPNYVDLNGSQLVSEDNMSLVSDNELSSSIVSEGSVMNTDVNMMEKDYITEPLVVVAHSSNSETKRKWDKRQCCVFCKKLVLKLPRHFFQMHKDEKDVKDILTLMPNDPQRLKILDQLRNTGNFVHNSSVLESKKGILIPKQRKSVPVSPSKLVPCPNCNIFVVKKNLYRHYKICKLTGRKDTSSVRRRVLGMATHMLPLSGKKRYLYLLETKVLKGMKENSILEEIRKDKTVLQFGAELYEKHEHLEQSKDNIRNKLREMGRFLIEIKKINSSVSELSDIFSGKLFDSVVDATKVAAKFNPQTNTFAIPSLARKIGESLQKCAAICRKDAIRNDDKILKQHVDDFMEMYNMEWTAKISSKALMTLHNAKFNKVELLPDPADMKLLAKFLENERKFAIENIKNDINASSFSRLAKITLASVIIFNRKRAGDAHNLKVNSYIQRNVDEPHSGVIQNLSTEEKQLIKEFVRLETRGKHGKKIPILLTKSMTEMIDLLLESREKAYIKQENPFVFAVPGTSSSCFRGSDVIREFRTKAETTHPDRITSTSLRKEAATLSAACGLTEQEVERLASFLGHTTMTHKKYYRLPQATMEKARVGKFLTDILHYETPQVKNDSEKTVPMATSTTEDNDYIPEEEDLSDDENWKRSKEVCGTKITKKKWSLEEKNAVMKELGSKILLGTVPGKADCENCIKKSQGVLSSRSWRQIKYYANNYIVSKKINYAK